MPRLLIAVLTALVTATPAAAVTTDASRTEREPIDAPTAAPVASGAAGADAAADRLRGELGPQSTVDLDPVTGTARTVARLDGFLTGASSASPAQVALAYVRAHADLFGDLDPSTLTLDRSYTDVLGTTHLTWSQTIGAIPTIDAGLRAAVAAGGQLVSIGGAPIAGLSAASTTPNLTAGEALARAGRAVGVDGAAPAIDRRSTLGRRTTAFASGDSAELAIASTPAGPRLAWQVQVTKSADEQYATVVDAGSGAILDRENTVKHATGLAWDYFPGPQPLNNSGVAITRDFTAKGWLASNATQLSGNNAHAYSDEPDDNSPSAADEIAPSSGSNWNYPLTRFNDGSWFLNCSENFPCTWDSATAGSWQTNRKQSGTQAFYFANTFHDYLAASPIGFTEAAGNFQVTNASGQGAGGDAVQVQVLDGANTDTAAGLPDANHLGKTRMVVGPDGTPPRLELSLATAQGSNGGDVDAADDASVVLHEYAHGLTGRLITDNDGRPALGGVQGRAMSEGWSDWYAMDYVVGHGFDADDAAVGDVNLGYWFGGGPGLRSQPLDCPTTVTADPCTNGNGAGNGGYTYGDLGAVVGAPEPHADGEIWAQTLWDLRRSLIAKYGATAGGTRVRTYVTRALELAPANPTMLDVRNAILQAETVATAAGAPFAGSDDTDVIWTVFAGRGMGYFAGTTGPDDADPVASTAKPPASGAPKSTVSGTVTLVDGGAVASGVRVTIAGPPGLTAVTGADGRYAIANVPNGTYPYVFVTGAGYDRTQTGSLAVTAATTRNFTIRRNWASSQGGGAVSTFTGPDLSGQLCGPAKAIDGDLATGWGSTSPTSTQGPQGAKSITIKLAATITLSSFGIDPGSTCGDDASASLGSYKLETSPNGTTFTVAKTGTFAAADNHRLNAVAPTAGTADVRYVRLTMNAPQGTSGSGKDWMDLSEIKVFGVGKPTATATPTPTPTATPAPTDPPAPTPAPTAAPTPAPLSETVPKPTPTPTPSLFTTSLSKPLAVSRSGGLALKVQGPPKTAGTITVTAKRLGKVPATKFRTAASGRATVQLKLGKRALGKLRKARRTTATLKVRLGTATETRTVTLKAP